MTYFTWPGYRTKALTLSYDDGPLSDEKLLSILNRYGIRATFNLNSACMDEERRISRERICELYQGHEIATHGAMHIQMDHMTTGSRNYCRGWGFIMRELQKAQEILSFLGIYTNGSPLAITMNGCWKRQRNFWHWKVLSSGI